MKTIHDIFTDACTSKADFAREYNIPLRTLEDWLAGRRTPPQYVVDLLAAAEERKNK